MTEPQVWQFTCDCRICNVQGYNPWYFRMNEDGLPEIRSSERGSEWNLMDRMDNSKTFMDGLREAVPDYVMATAQMYWNNQDGVL
jgi:hypothetical protein